MFNYDWRIIVSKLERWLSLSGYEELEKGGKDCSHFFANIFAFHAISSSYSAIFDPRLSPLLLLPPINHTLKPFYAPQHPNTPPRQDSPTSLLPHLPCVRLRDHLERRPNSAQTLHQGGLYALRCCEGGVEGGEGGRGEIHPQGCRHHG